MITYSGTVHIAFKPFLSEICTLKSQLNRSGRVLVSENTTSCPEGYAGLITASSTVFETSKPTVILPKTTLSRLKEGDFVIISPTGEISLVWDNASVSNALFLTPACDCYCIMCPQPPQKHDDATLKFAEQLVEQINPTAVTNLCVTGGEPTLMGDRFIKLMQRINDRFPHASIILLSNGKNFSNRAFAKEFAAIGFKNCTVCISFHSDLEELNDQIAGVSGSFHKTTQGLYNLARFRQKIEIRHVISKLNAFRLDDFANFLYRNFPFAVHVALMGMEITGYARDNFDEVWIDPYDYKQYLGDALVTLHRAAVHVSAYNIPLCLLEPRSRRFARQSISEWKNSYIPCCDKCSLKSQCCGVFTTSGEYLSSHICPQ